MLLTNIVSRHKKSKNCWKVEHEEIYCCGNVDGLPALFPKSYFISASDKTHQYNGQVVFLNVTGKIRSLGSDNADFVVEFAWFWFRDRNNFWSCPKDEEWIADFLKVRVFQKVFFLKWSSECYLCFVFIVVSSSLDLVFSSALVFLK